MRLIYSPSTLRYCAKERLRYWLSEAAPRLFCAIERKKSADVPRSVGPDSDFVLEGYPRSGNSFAFRTLKGRLDGRRSWRIAHHIHLPVQVTLGVYWRKPILVLVRRPDEAIVSFVALQCQATLRQGGRQGSGVPFSKADLTLRLTEAARYYARYYKKLLSLKGGEFVIAPFEVVVLGLGDVFREVNKRFDLDIPDFPVKEEERAIVFSAGGQHLSPSVDRDSMKREIEPLWVNGVSASVKQDALSAYAECLEMVRKAHPRWAQVVSGERPMK